MKPTDIVFSGAGVVTPNGKSLEEVANHILGDDETKFLLNDYKAAGELSDRRMMKAVSTMDSWGLAAVEKLKKDHGFDNDQYDTFAKSVYVGAPPSSPWDNENYLPAMKQTIGADGLCQEKEFGETCMTARPTTLLLGLPNNVLCYSAIIMDARGPNSNYTSGETSGMLAIGNAARSIQRGRSSCSLAGAYSGLNEPVFRSMYRQNGLMSEGDNQPIEPYQSKNKGTNFSDGAAFYLLEKRLDAEKNGRKPIATYIHSVTGSESKGELARSQTPPVLARTIKRCLDDSGVRADEIGLVFMAGSGIDAMDQAELTAIEMSFENSAQKPAVTTLSTRIGNLMEAGGLIEIGVASSLYQHGKLSPSMQSIEGYSKTIDRTKPYTMIFRTTVMGDINVMIIKVEQNQET